MRASRTVVGAILAISGGLLIEIAHAGTESIEGDLARLQGRWVTRAGERGELCVSLEIRGDEASVAIRTPQGLTLEAKGTVRLDESVSPHALDWVGFTGADTIELPDIPAIYEFVDGGFRVCNGGPNNARPSTFKAGAGVLAGLHRFERPVGTVVAGGPGAPPRR